MGKGAVITAGIMGVGIASAGIYYTVMQKSGPHLAKLAPQRAIVWCEADSTGSSWDDIKKGKVFSSFKKSELSDQFDEQWKALVESAEKGGIPQLKELGLPLNEQTIRRFVGQDVAFGILAPAAEAAPPSFVFMSQLDVLGIAKDMSVEGDWTKVWSKLSKALGGEKATGDTFEGVEIKTKKIEGTDKEVHFALLGSVIVASDSHDALKDVISAQKGKTPSLADLPAFAKETARLPRGQFAEVYVDASFFADKRKLGKCIQATASLFPKDFPTDPIRTFDIEILDVLANDFAPNVGGVSFGWSMTAGDLFHATLAASKTQEEVFKDAKERDISSILPDTTVFVHARSFYELVQGFRQSPAWDKLAHSEGMVWLQKKLEKPEELMKLADPKTAAEMTSAKKPDGKTYKTDGTFYARAVSGAYAAFAHQLHGELAVSVDMPLTADSDPSDPSQFTKVTGFFKAQPIPRLVSDLLAGYVATIAAKTPKKEGPKYGPGYQRKVARIESDVWAIKNGAQMFKLDSGRAPANLGELLKAPADAKQWNGPYVMGIEKDPWAHDYVLKSSEQGVDVTCLGADGKEGGTGEDQDLNEANLGQISMSLWRREPSFEVVDHAKGKIFGFNPGAPVTIYWTQVGRHVAIGNDLEHLKTVLDRAHGAPPSPTKAIVSRLADGEQLTVYVNQKRLYTNILPIFERDAKKSPDAQRVLDLQRNMADSFDMTLVKVYVAKDYSALTVRSVATLGEKADPKMKQLWVNASPEPAALSWLPAETFVSLCGKADPKANHGYFLNLAVQAMGKEAVDGMLKEWKDFTGHELEADFVNKLGGEVGVGLIVQDKLVPEGTPAEQAKMMPAVPALVAAIEMKDPTFQAAFLDSVKAVIKKENERNAQRRPTAKPIEVVEKKLGAQPIFALVSPDAEEMKGLVGDGLSPCCAFVDSWLIIATSESALARTLAAKKDGKNLSKSPAFAKILGSSPRQVAYLMHWDWAGVVDEVEKNAELIVRNFAPAPEGLEAPKYPDAPAGGTQKDWDEYEKKMVDYRKADQEYKKKVAEAREAKAPENATTLKKYLANARALGGAFASTTITKDGMESTSVAQLDLAALTPAPGGESADEAMEAIFAAPMWSIAATAIPNLIQARTHGNEAAAIGALRTLATSQAIYREGDKDGNGQLDYGSLTDLGKTKLIDAVLASGVKQGYRFQCEASTETKEFLWWATAEPIVPGTTGNRYFFTNQAGAIFYSNGPLPPIDKKTCEVPAGLIPSGR